jgi:glutathione S-transferase
MSYLNTKFGWGPADAESRAHIDQILAVVTDGVAEGRLAFHPKDFYASHQTQVGAAATAAGEQVVREAVHAVAALNCSSAPDSLTVCLPAAAGG